jgi:hypothetical protein
MKKDQKINRKILIAVLVVLVTFGAYLPAKQTHAMVVEDITTEIQSTLNNVADNLSMAFDAISSYAEDLIWIKDYILDPLAWVTSKGLLQDMTNSTVNWINSGFKGSPSFVQNPESFFQGIGDNIAGNFIAGSGSPLAALCSPIALNVRLALALNQAGSSGGGSGGSNPYSCTLSSIINNVRNASISAGVTVNGMSIAGFEGGDFSQGGWPAFAALAEPQNSFYGAYLESEADLSTQVAQKTATNQKLLDQGNGFMSYQQCAPTTSSQGSDQGSGNDVSYNNESDNSDYYDNSTDNTDNVDQGDNSTDNTDNTSSYDENNNDNQSDENVDTTDNTDQNSSDNQSDTNTQDTTSSSNAQDTTSQTTDSQGNPLYADPEAARAAFEEDNLGCSGNVAGGSSLSSAQCQAVQTNLNSGNLQGVYTAECPSGASTSQRCANLNTEINGPVAPATGHVNINIKARSIGKSNVASAITGLGNMLAQAASTCQIRDPDTGECLDNSTVPTSPPANTYDVNGLYYDNTTHVLQYVDQNEQNQYEQQQNQQMHQQIDQLNSNDVTNTDNSSGDNNSTDNTASDQSSYDNSSGDETDYSGQTDETDNTNYDDTSDDSYVDDSANIPDAPPGADTGENCQTVTPGSVISSSLNKALGGSQDSLVQSSMLGEIIGALAGKLVNQVLGSGGLSSVSHPSNGQPSYLTQVEAEVANSSANTSGLASSLSSSLSPYITNTTQIQTYASSSVSTGESALTALYNASSTCQSDGDTAVASQIGIDIASTTAWITQLQGNYTNVTNNLNRLVSLNNQINVATSTAQLNALTGQYQNLISAYNPATSPYDQTVPSISDIQNAKTDNGNDQGIASTIISNAATYTNECYLYAHPANNGGF